MFLKYLHLVVFAATSITLIGAQEKKIGFTLLILGVIFTIFSEKTFRNYFLLIYLCLFILGLTPINTDTSMPHAFYMGTALLAVIIIPYLVSKKLLKQKTITYPNLKEKSWDKKRTYYIIFAALVAYLLLPLMLRSDSSYQNWIMEPGFWNLLGSYLGLNFVGIWDELFFVITILAILRKFYPFFIANIAQAVLFTSFLYTLGFQGWSFMVIFVFAIIQGLIFRKTKSLLYILAIHLTIDLVLHITLVNLHYPHLFPIFIT